MPASPAPIAITRHLPPGGLDDLVALYLEAFGRKAEHLLFMTADRATIAAVTRRSIRPEQGLYAMREGRVVGYLGLEARGGRRFLDPTLAILTDAFGRWGGLWRYGVHMGIAVFEPHKRGALQIDQLAVGAAARGQGIGTRLIEAAAAIAREEGYARLTLDVIDTNPAARRLYERLGFRLVRRQRLGAWTRRAGFEAVDFMERPIDTD